MLKGKSWGRAVITRSIILGDDFVYVHIGGDQSIRNILEKRFCTEDFHLGCVWAD